MAVKRKAKAKKAKPKTKSRRGSKLMQMQYNLSPELAEIVGAKCNAMDAMWFSTFF